MFQAWSFTYFSLVMPARVTFPNPTNRLDPTSGTQGHSTTTLHPTAPCRQHVYTPKSDTCSNDDVAFACQGS